MTDLVSNILLYTRYEYGAQILYRNRIMCLKTEDDIYRIDVSLAHEGIIRFYSLTFPIAFTETNFARGIFRLAAHKTYKEIRQLPSNADWEKFVNDAYKYGYTLQ